MRRISLSCGNCAWNDDFLCDKYGRWVKDDDKACNEWEREKVRETEETGDIAKKQEL